MHGQWEFAWPWAIFNLLFWAGLIALAVWAVLRMTRGNRAVVYGPPPGVQPPSYSPPRETARDILDRRYASSEIDADTYEEMRDRLERRDNDPAG